MNDDDELMQKDDSNDVDDKVLELIIMFKISKNSAQSSS